MIVEMSPPLWLPSFFPGDMQESSPLHTATAQEDVVRQMERITDGARVPCFVFCMNMLIWDVWSQRGLTKPRARPYKSVVLFGFR